MKIIGTLSFLFKEIIHRRRYCDILIWTAFVERIQDCLQGYLGRLCCDVGYVGDCICPVSEVNGKVLDSRAPFVYQA